ncbi:MAG: hypothetical protein EBS01_00260, partial [Verrucomicrobia bacterium]|nr:hypothetical protein [Verrucomicrobiota bacterium]
MNKTLESINSNDAVSGLRSVTLDNGATTITASPWVFSSHDPGWRNEVPVFVKNHYVANSLNRTLLKSAYPSLLLGDVAEVETTLWKAEPDLNSRLGTRADSTPPSLMADSSTDGTLNSYDGTVTIQGYVKDAAGVKGVLLTATCGASVEYYDAVLESLDPDADGLRKYRWTATITLPAGFSGGVQISANATDYLGAITDVPLSQSLTVNRLVPFSVTYSGNGTVSFSPTPDENGFLPVGTRVIVSTKPAAGSLLRRIETVIDGQPQPLPTVRTVTQSVILRGDTTVSVVFEPNPYLLVAGRNKFACNLLDPKNTDFKGTSGGYVEGVFPLSSLQLAVTALGSFSGRLVVGRDAYNVAGKFDADGFYSTSLKGLISRLDWTGSSTPTNYVTSTGQWISGNGYSYPINYVTDVTTVMGINPSPSSNAVAPTRNIMPLFLMMWIDTSGGVDAPVIRALLANGNGIELGGRLYPAGDLNYTGTPLYTGTFLRSDGTQWPRYATIQPGSSAFYSSKSYGLPPNGTTITSGSLPASGGCFSLAARKSGAATVLGTLPNGDKFTSATWLVNQAETPTQSIGSLRLLSAVGTNGAFGMTAFLSTPLLSSGTAYASVWARREGWYPGNRGPVLEVISTLVNGVPTPSATSVFAREWCGASAPFTVPELGDTLDVSALAPSATTPMPAFTLQAANRTPSVITGAVVPNSMQNGYISAQMSLSLSTGLMTGSVQIASGKRVSLQGALIHNGVSAWSGAASLLGAKAVWAAPD